MQIAEDSRDSEARGRPVTPSSRITPRGNHDADPAVALALPSSASVPLRQTPGRVVAHPSVIPAKKNYPQPTAAPYPSEPAAKLAGSPCQSPAGSSH